MDQKEYIIHWTVDYRYPIRVRNHGWKTMTGRDRETLTVTADNHNGALEAAKARAAIEYQWIIDRGGSFTLPELTATPKEEHDARVRAEVEGYLNELVRDEQYEIAAVVRDIINEEFNPKQP